MIKKLLLLTLICSFGFFTGSTLVLAQEQHADTTKISVAQASITDAPVTGTAITATKGKNLQDAFPEGNSLLESTGKGAGFDVGERKIDPIIANVISVVLSLLGVIFLVLMVYGGYTWMTAAGNDIQVTKARNIVVAAIIGLIIVVAAYAITYFIFFRVASRLIE